MLYEFECEECGKVTEESMSLNVMLSGATPTCACGGATKKLISSNTTFVLKGSGWAKDGYSSQKSGATSDE